MLLELKRLFTKMFWIFPIDKNKIFFSSYEGKQYSCNPRVVYEYLKEKDSNKRYVWEYNFENIPDDIRSVNCIVKHNSLSYFFHLLTSKYIISNSGISASISLRRKQICINTWHGGGAYKKVGTAICENVNGTSTKEMKIMAIHTSGFVSSSSAFTDLMTESTLVDKEKFLEYGMPRNDVFFSDDLRTKAIKRVKDYLNVTGDSKYVLFAPTYRGSAGNNDYNTLIPDLELLISSLEKRFDGEWKVLIRSHYYKLGMTKIALERAIDVTDYPDMQDLLCFSDVLITDYSSSIWDFSLTCKPCFLYVPDLNDYINERGGFYTDISTWPGIVSLNDSELSENIEKFNFDDYKKKVHRHHTELGSCDDGHATQKLVEYLKL